jgi:ATP-dependent RNA helicase DeaD
VADLHGKRLELTRASLHERLLAGNLDDVRVIVESLAQEFDVVDVAAAAVKLAHAALNGDGDTENLDIPPPPQPRADRPRHQGPQGGVAASQRKSGAHSNAGGRLTRPRPVDGGGATTRLYVGAGRNAGIRPGDLVGAIVNEAGLSSQDLGAIQIADRFSLVEVPESRADEVVSAMKKTTLRGQKVQIRRDREAPRSQP